MVDRGPTASSLAVLRPEANRAIARPADRKVRSTSCPPGTEPGDTARNLTRSRRSHLMPYRGHEGGELPPPPNLLYTGPGFGQAMHAACRRVTASYSGPVLALFVACRLGVRGVRGR
jgi:hypothetical protein